MLSTDLLIAFATVANRGSVSDAARELGLAKSVVSKRLVQLEETAGATLLTRTTRRISLTPAGTIYLEFARRMLDMANQAQEDLRALRTDLTGLVRVTAPASWGHRVIGALLPIFLSQHPGLEIELLLEDRVMDLAYERIDLALRMSTFTPPDLVAMPIARLDWTICASPAYLDGTSIPTDPGDLATHACMNYWRTARHNQWDLVRDGRTVTVPVKSRYRANHPEAVVDAAVAGLGIALLPLYCAERELADGRLIRLLPDWTPRTAFGDTIIAVALPDRIRLARNQALLRFLRSHLRR